MNDFTATASVLDRAAARLHRLTCDCPQGPHPEHVAAATDVLALVGEDLVEAVTAFDVSQAPVMLGVRCLEAGYAKHLFSEVIRLRTEPGAGGQAR